MKLLVSEQLLNKHLSHIFLVRKFVGSHSFSCIYLQLQHCELQLCGLLIHDGILITQIYIQLATPEW